MSPSMMVGCTSLTFLLRTIELAFSFGLGLMTGVLNWLSGKIEPLGLLISVRSLVYHSAGVCVPMYVDAAAGPLL
jgi:hypothetical protein